ncbi:MAG: holo-ACP synthase [Acidimicrobiales bacterium]|nr:holo-ACP synthase [Acidimicrobiales bacterium]
MVGVGVDVVDPVRFEQVLARRPALEERVFTPAERELAVGAQRLSRLSTRFAAKEAAWKALGVGMGAVGLRDVEVVGGGDEAPSLSLHGRAAALASRSGVRRWHLSLTHTERTAIAFVVAEGAPGASSPTADRPSGPHPVRLDDPLD